MSEQLYFVNFLGCQYFNSTNLALQLTSKETSTDFKPPFEI